MSNTKITIDMEANISQIKNAANEINSIFSKLNLPASTQKSFSSTFSKLTAEVRNFETMASKGLNSVADTAKAEKSVDKIISLFENLKVQAKDINGANLEKFIPDSVLSKMKQYKELLGQVEQLQKKDNSGNTKVLERDLDALNQKLKKSETSLAGLKAAQDKAFARKENAQTQYNALAQQIENARAKQAALIAEGKKQNISEQVTKSSPAYQRLNNEIKAAQEQQRNFNREIDRANKTIGDNDQKIATLSSSINITRQDIAGLTAELQRIQSSSTATEAEVQALVQKFIEISGINLGNTNMSLEELSQRIRDMIAEGLDTTQIVTLIQQLGDNCQKGASGATSLASGVRQISKEKAGIAQMNSEVDMLKNRLSYFFSIINGVQLFKRAIRSAFEGVKELDAAMTEMAVVTQYTVDELWGQMPQYAENANKLGATTLDVYKSMVLYTQQGLKMAQAQQLSNETLKMARIAGMEASDATDAMTSALRGFNMELTEASGQRVNDVYSNLAAHAAANTEEISDAMMRTASIAHGAGMEFETTAAFLTQMINHVTYTRVA